LAAAAAQGFGFTAWGRNSTFQGHVALRRSPTGIDRGGGFWVTRQVSLRRLAKFGDVEGFRIRRQQAAGSGLRKRRPVPPIWERSAWRFDPSSDAGWHPPGFKFLLRLQRLAAASSRSADQVDHGKRIGGEIRGPWRHLLRLKAVEFAEQRLVGHIKGFTLVPIGLISPRHLHLSGAVR